MKYKITYTKEEEAFLEEIKSEKLQKFEAEWKVNIKTDEDLHAFYIFQLSIQRDALAGLLKKQIDLLSGKEHILLPFMAAIFLHYKAYYLWREETNLLEAQNLLLKAIELLKTLDGDSTETYKGRIFDTLGLLMKSESQLKEAAAMFQLAIKYKSLGNDLEGLALSYGNLGRLNMEIGDFEGSIKYLVLDINLMQKHFPDNIFIQAQLISTLAWSYLENNQLYKAKEKYEESKVLNTQLNNPTGLFYNEIGLAEVALKNQLLEESSGFTKSAYQYLKSKNFFQPAYQSSLVQYTFVEAMLLKMESKPDEAQQSLQDILDHQQDSINNIQFAKILLALSEVSAGDQKIKHLKKTLEILDKTEHVKMRLQVEGLLKEISKSDFLLHAAGRFVGKDQIERLIDNAGAEGFQGEETELVVLFSDIRGFTTLSEKLSPQELITTLNRFFYLDDKSDHRLWRLCR